MAGISAKKQYKIPWAKVICAIVLVLGILIITVAPAVVMFIGIFGAYPAVVSPSLFLMLLFGYIFFMKIQLWTNVMFSPLKNWIRRIIPCPECGRDFTICEYTMEHPSALATFICYCGNCRRATVLETGMFDKTLTFRPERSIESLYEKKYHGEAYKVPRAVSIMNLAVYAVPVLLFVFVLLIAPALIYVRCFGPSREAAEKFRSLNMGLFIGLLMLWNAIYWSSPRLRSFVTYPLRRWILDNVKCPGCGGLLAKCEVELPAWFFDFFKYGMIYTVHCGQCKRKGTMEIGGFDSLLRFA